ncbi:glycosyl transferase [Pseudoalteromonas sp. KS88]|uniref:glycosyltransferase n=1 Tax=Pseudoalteromonas sp. KS88 TaxID=2109918 RepID=UPI00107FFD9E|nr:glycosyltransferase [Pseudoalteromonas sp. KS88]TGE79853.1 glycosyl transferase [Pseudoalteromonas sp. KS88]
MTDKIAVLMSVYSGDKLHFIESAVQSILTQSYSHFHFYIAVDGKISEEASAYLNNLNQMKQVSVFFYPENKGLATRLNQLLDHIADEGFTYVARMDADDISHTERFAKQINFINQHNLDVIGSNLIEIDENGAQLQEKKMFLTHQEIAKNIVKRCPVNHPTVMFRADLFSKGIRYNAKLLNTQDYELWVRLIKMGYKFGNINESLLYFRVDSNFFKRRSIKKVFNEVKYKLFAWFYLTRSISDLFFIVAFFIMRVSPKFLQKLAYKRLR